MSDRKTEITSYKILISSLTPCFLQLLNTTAITTILAVLKLLVSFSSWNEFYF